MEKNTRATDQQMIEEAVFRMKTLGFPQQYIDEFKEGFLHTFLSPSGKDRLMDEYENDVIRDAYEHHYNGYTWALIKNEGTGLDTEMREWDEYYVLFVSDDHLNWEKERQELFEMEPTMFLVSYPIMPDPYTFVGEFVKKKIRLTEDVILVLA